MKSIVTTVLMLMLAVLGSGCGARATATVTIINNDRLAGHWQGKNIDSQQWFYRSDIMADAERKMAEAQRFSELQRRLEAAEAQKYAGTQHRIAELQQRLSLAEAEAMVKRTPPSPAEQTVLILRAIGDMHHRQ